MSSFIISWVGKLETHWRIFINIQCNFCTDHETVSRKKIFNRRALKTGDNINTSANSLHEIENL